MHMKRLLPLIGVLLGLVWSINAVAAAPAESRDPYKYFFENSFGDFSEELARAKQAGKKGLLIFFELDECPFCHRMKETVLNQENVQQYFKQHFLSFAVDIEGATEVVNFQRKNMLAKDFAVKENRVRATPVFAFFDLEGKAIARFTGATTGVEEFLLLGQYVADGHYKKLSFPKFKRSLQSKKSG